MTPATIRKLFFSVLSDTENNIDSFVNKPGSDMTRHRYCDFSDTVLATLSFSMNRSNTELLHFFGLKTIHIPSKSAFTQQRHKFNSRLFPHLLMSFNEAVPFTKTFKGYHLVAVDGSDINLPTDKNDTVYRVKQARSDNYYYQMHLNALYDICENRYITAITQPRAEMNENQAFCQMIDDSNLPENTIFIADRGYISFNTLAHLIEKNKYFLIRAKSPASSGSMTKGLLNGDIEEDRFVSIGLSRSGRKLKHMAVDKRVFIRKKRKFDFIESDDTESIYEMNVRVTAVSIGENSMEYLISNLPMDTFSAQALKDLYWKRWAIETSFRSLKYALSLVYLHSVNRELIIQEIYAKLLLYNFTSLIHSYVENSREFRELQKRRNTKCKVSFDDAVPIAKKLLKSKIKDDKIKALLLRHISTVKVIAPSARHMRSQTVKPLNNRA